MKKNFLAISPVYWVWLGRGFLGGIFLTVLLITILTRKMYAKKLTGSLYSLINSVPQGVMLFSSTGEIIAINRAMEQFLNISEQNIIGISYKKIFSRSELRDVKKLIDTSFGEEVPLIEKEVILKGNAPSMTLVFSFVPILNKSEFFENAQVKYATQRKTRRGELTDFEIICPLSSSAKEK